MSEIFKFLLNIIYYSYVCVCVCIVADSSLDWLIKVGYGQFKVSFIPLSITLSHDYDSCNFQLNKKKRVSQYTIRMSNLSIHLPLIETSPLMTCRNVLRRRCSQYMYVLDICRHACLYIASYVHRMGSLHKRNL